MFDEPKERQKTPLSELIHKSRAVEIARISEALRRNENILITGKYVTGKTKLSQEILEMAGKGKIWPEKNIKSAYFWTDRVLEGDSMTTEELEKVDTGELALVVMDEVATVSDNPELMKPFMLKVKEFNERGILVIAVGWASPELVHGLSSLFSTVIDFQFPPETMSESDLKIYQDANKVYEDGPFVD